MKAAGLVLALLWGTPAVAAAPMACALFVRGPSFEAIAVFRGEMARNFLRPRCEGPALFADRPEQPP